MTWKKIEETTWRSGHYEVELLPISQRWMIKDWYEDQYIVTVSTWASETYGIDNGSLSFATAQEAMTYCDEHFPTDPVELNP